MPLCVTSSLRRIFSTSRLAVEIKSAFLYQCLTSLAVCEKRGAISVACPVVTQNQYHKSYWQQRHLKSFVQLMAWTTSYVESVCTKPRADVGHNYRQYRALLRAQDYQKYT